MTTTRLRSRSGKRLTVTAVVLMAAMMTTQLALAEWPQFGGVNRDFKAQSGRLADQWPEGGPRRLWERPLGDGSDPCCQECRVCGAEWGGGRAGGRGGEGCAGRASRG